MWFIGSTQVADAEGPITKGVGIAIQAAFLAIPLIALERVAEAAEARHRPLRATYVIAVVYLAHLQGLGGLSTIEETTDPEKWGRLGAYLLIGGLIAGARHAVRERGGAGDRRRHRTPLPAAPPLRRIADGASRPLPLATVPGTRWVPRSFTRVTVSDTAVSDTGLRAGVGPASASDTGWALTSFHILSNVSRSAVCMSMPRPAASCSTCSTRDAELVGRRPQRDLRIDVEVTGDVDDREQQIAELVGDRVVA